MEIVGKDSIAGWRGLLGPTNSEEARASAPESIRGRFGSDGTLNACHGSDAPDTAAQVGIARPLQLCSASCDALTVVFFAPSRTIHLSLIHI